MHLRIVAGDHPTPVVTAADALGDGDKPGNLLTARQDGVTPTDSAGWVFRGA